MEKNLGDEERKMVSVNSLKLSCLWSSNRIELRTKEYLLFGLFLNWIMWKHVCMVMEQYSREEEIKTKEKKNSEEAKSLAAIGPVFTS